MTITLYSTADLWTTADDHLRGAPERVMFFTAGADDNVVSDLFLVQDHDLEPGAWCVQLTDDAQQRMLYWAAQRDGWLIEAHSHLGHVGDPARLSPLDISGLKEWVPYVRWRLRLRPYAAVVVGPTTIDGVAWDSPNGTSATPIHDWKVDDTAMEMTGLSLPDIRDPR